MTNETLDIKILQQKVESLQTIIVKIQEVLRVQKERSDTQARAITEILRTLRNQEYDITQATKRAKGYW